MKYCIECLYPNTHPLGITFNSEGLCSGCIVHKEKFEINWEKKENELKDLLTEYKNESYNNWDCIVPVSGGRDSYFIVDLIKNKYKMNPLLVTYNKHYNSHTGNRNIAYLKTIFDCDHISLTVDPNIVKKLTRYTLESFGSVYWHCIAGQMVFPVRIAVNFKIPLIIWGVHQGVDQVGMFSHHDKVEMNRRYRIEHDMMGYKAEDFIGKVPNLTKEDLSPFIYPNDNEIEAVGVRGIYLSNYISWDTKKQHELMINKYDYKTLNIPRTFDIYNDADSLVYSDVHDFLKYIKHGYSKVTDHLSREIRWERINRKNALELNELYSQRSIKYLDIFCDWLGLNKDQFFNIADKHINRNIFDSKLDCKTIYFHLTKNNLSTTKDNYLEIEKNGIDKYDIDYTLLEKGYENKKPPFIKS